MIKVDKFKAEDVTDLSRLVREYNIPNDASVCIRTDATGTHIVFEWIDEKYKPVVKVKPAFAGDWYKDKPYYKPEPKKPI